MVPQVFAGVTTQMPCGSGALSATVVQVPAVAVRLQAMLTIAAPIAAGSPKPIVPRPPELMWLFGRRNPAYRAAHIWFWPTSATIVA